MAKIAKEDKQVKTTTRDKFIKALRKTKKPETLAEIISEIIEDDLYEGFMFPEGNECVRKETLEFFSETLNSSVEKFTQQLVEKAWKRATKGQ